MWITWGNGSLNGEAQQTVPDAPNRDPFPSSPLRRWTLLSPFDPREIRREIRRQAASAGYYWGSGVLKAFLGGRVLIFGGPTSYLNTIFRPTCNPLTEVFAFTNAPRRNQRSGRRSVPYCNRLFVRVDNYVPVRREKSCTVRACTVCT